ncbi:AAA family ATPase [Nostoc sp. CCCryo 231-06]|nr:AAA family ATPase [Nostoc sp. CCCryo 231-06]
MLLTDWHEILENILPDESNEAYISDIFVRPLINALGFNQKEHLSEFKTGNGTVDFAARKNIDSDIFDVIPADPKLGNFTEQDLATRIEKGSARLKDALKAFVYEYDYIFIDCPTNWMFFSQSSLYACDIVLIPTKHNNLASLDNAAKVIKELVPKVKAARRDGGPIALPIFFNGENITPPQLKIANQEIASIINREIKASKFNLLPYFYPKYIKADTNTTIFSLPSYAIVAGAAFARIPAAFKDSTAAKYYLELAKEYFIL